MSVVDSQHLLHSYLLTFMVGLKVPPDLVINKSCLLIKKTVQVCVGSAFLYNRSKYIIRYKQPLNEIQSIEKNIQNVLAFILR